MIMKNIENVLNEFAARLLATGSAEFSQDGINIKSTYKNGNFNIEASFVNPLEDKVNELTTSFEEYIKSLSDDFFLEVVESFEDGRLKFVQDKLDSKNLKAVREGIEEFMAHLKAVAASKVNAIDKDMEDLKKELTELSEIRDSYVHVLNKKF